MKIREGDQPHPHNPRASPVEFQYPSGEQYGSQLFIARQYLEGQTLKRRVPASPLKADEILELGMQIADGLEGAHSKGIIHRI
jgi:eukaryotic-like serine/threonine-protein kinase